MFELHHVLAARFFLGNVSPRAVVEDVAVLQNLQERRAAMRMREAMRDLNAARGGDDLALNIGLLTVGLDTVEFADLYLHDELLDVAFVGRNDPYRPLAEHIAEIVGKPGKP